MAASLQLLIDDTAAARLAAQIRAVWAPFDAAAFVAESQRGWSALELMARGQRLADLLQRYLPAAYPQALAILVASMGPPLALDARGEPRAEPGSGSSFFYLPHSRFIAAHGQHDVPASLAAMHALTQRFTAEFCIRPFLEQAPQATWAQLHVWAHDPSAHVRRLVSEGTRPRLPWAPRQRALQRDPAPVLPLLEALRDDPSSYVRRSVANHLNDIGKDHPNLLLQVAARWLDGASAQRRQLVQHALRSQLKAGDAAALQLIGLGHATALRLSRVHINPQRPRIGEAVTLDFELHNHDATPQRARLDLAVRYVKADGSTRPKVFRLPELSLAPGEHQRVSHRLSLRQMTTRTHYPGRHQVDLVLNGQARVLGHFDLRSG